MRCIACGSNEPREIHRCPTLDWPPCPHCAEVKEVIGKLDEVRDETLKNAPIPMLEITRPCPQCGYKNFSILKTKGKE